MNILVIVVLLVLLWKVTEGYKRGMVREIISFVSLVVLCVMAALLMNGLKSYMEKQFVGVAIAVLLLCLVAVAHHFLGLFFFSAKMISKLPVIHLADKLLGTVVGIFETVLILWTVYFFVDRMGMIGQQILEYVQENKVLSWLYSYNFLRMWVESFGWVSAPPLLSKRA